MKKTTLAVASAITILASGSVSAQTVSNGPYYANPAWDQQLPAAQRFIVLQNWNNEAVLDRETGLVWQRQPSTGPAGWLNAMEQCHLLLAGNRRSWRLPSYEELTSLIDGTQNDLALPPGHPFLGIDDVTPFWSTSTWELGTQSAWVVNFIHAAEGRVADKSTGSARFWCVRGGSSTDNLP
jgi:hypothetical protein